MPALAVASWTLYLRAEDRKVHGLSALDVINGLKAAKIAETDLIWTEGQQNWIEARGLRELLINEIRNRQVTEPTPNSIEPPAIVTVPLADKGHAPAEVDRGGELKQPRPHVEQADGLHGTGTISGGTLERASAAPIDPALAKTEKALLNAERPNDYNDKPNDQVVASSFIQAPRQPEEPTEEIDPTDLGEFNPEETGVIATYLPEKLFGHITIEGKPRLHFFRRALPQNAPRELVGLKVLANVVRGRKGITASSIKILDNQETPIGKAPADLAAKYYDELRRLSREVRPGKLLAKWSNLDASLPRPDFGHERQVRDSVPELASICLNERWCFDYDVHRDKYAILRKYITYTFYRLFREGKVAFSATHATFNTGLVDKLFEPIYALFARNSQLGSRPYRFLGFCVAGDERSGKELMARFAKPDRPEPAQYMTSFDEVIFDPSCHVTIQYKHVIDDAILRARYPLEFLLKHLPSSMRNTGEPSLKDQTWLRNYVNALNENSQRKRAFASDIRYAAEFAQKRARWNYKTAIPNYFPTRNQMSLLLPLALLDDTKPDMAMVASRVNDHEYYGVTVYPLDMAYTSARLVCRPDSDWLTPEVETSSDIEEDDDLLDEASVALAQQEQKSIEPM